MSNWKLVPVEPTLEMVWKAEEDSPEFQHGDSWYGSEPPSEGQIRAIYTAMLEAAPQPPKLSDERIYQVWGEQAEKTIGKSHSEFLVSFVRAIEREIFGRVI